MGWALFALALGSWHFPRHLSLTPLLVVCSLQPLLGANPVGSALIMSLFAVPPAPPEVRDSGGFLLGDTVGPYDEGESMSITCLSANSGSPPPKLTW